MNLRIGTIENTVHAFMNRLPAIDWILFLITIPLLGAGLSTMNSFTGDSVFYEHQLVWIVVSLIAFFFLSLIDFRFLRRTRILVGLYTFFCLLLVLLFFFGSRINGTQGWFDIGSFSFQPAEPAKLVLILVLAKYFSKRHVEIAHWKHIIVSGIYPLIFFVLVFLQPDFGTAIIIFLVWFGMVLISGISKKHLLIVAGIGILSFLFLWLFVFAPYQKERIMNFIHPLTNVRGSGYNAYQSTIAVGSGQIFGKGVGYGTQSRLKFLPEYQTDFVFAAFAEEWGFVGVMTLFLLYGILIWRILWNGIHGASNFETLYAFGLAILFIAHFTIHVGMNIGLLPITGTTIPFLSYGGTHLLTEFVGLGILMGMRKYRLAGRREIVRGNDFLGV